MEGKDQKLPIKINGENEKLKRLFTYRLQHIDRSNMLQQLQREKLHKLVLLQEIKESYYIC